MGEKETKADKKGTMSLFFSMLWKARLPYLWIAAYIAASMGLTNVGIQVTEYTAEMFAGNVSFTGVVAPFLLYTIVSLGISSVAGVLSGLCTARIDRNLRRALWARIVRLPFAFYQENEPQKLVSRITTDVTAVSQLVMQVFVQLITTVYATILIFRQINSYDTKLMITLVVLLPLQVIIAFLAGRLQFGLGDQINQKQADLTQSIAERTRQSMLIKSFGTQEKETALVGRRIREFFRVSMRNSWVVSLLTPVYSIVGAMQFILLVLVGRYFYSDGAISLAQWVAFFAFANQLVNNLTAYTGYWTSLRAAQGLTRRLSGIMSEQEEDINRGDDAEGIDGDIEFRDVSFDFGDKPLFEHMNLRVPKGKTTAIVGKSGSGKTTLLNLILRLYPPKTGSILFGGTDIERFHRRSYRSAISCITQETVLFSGTIRENLVMGMKREVSDQELDEVCRMAGIDGLIQSLPMLYETDVGEGGANFSGGERQMLAAARAFLKPAEYFLIDEGTSALDANAKDGIWQALREQMAGKTVVYVAHDRQTILQADYVIVLDQGKVLAQGDFDKMCRENAYIQELMEEGAHETR